MTYEQEVAAVLAICAVLYLLVWAWLSWCARVDQPPQDSTAVQQKIAAEHCAKVARKRAAQDLAETLRVSKLS